MQIDATLYKLAKSGIMDMPELDDLTTAAMMAEVMSDRPKKQTREDAIIAGLIGDRTPDSYRRRRLLADLEGMASFGGYIPDFFCDTRVAEALVDEGLATRFAIPNTKPKRVGYRKTEVPF